MAAIGLFSDSDGDLDAFDAAYELLRGKGARRFIFAGGRYRDLDDWIARRQRQAQSGRSYSNTDFLADVSSFLSSEQQVDRPAAFGEAAEEKAESEDLAKIKDRFLRTPEKGSPEHRDPSVPKKAVDMLGDALVCVVHDKNELTKEDMLNATVILHGASGEPKVVQIGPRYFVTPGRLKNATERTCALIQTVDKTLKVTAFTLEGKVVLAEQTLSAGGKTKVSVK
ncbi:MAG: hypothetical protein ACYC8T_19480 [Myxococcaceae bacterium]